MEAKAGPAHRQEMPKQGRSAPRMSAHELDGHLELRVASGQKLAASDFAHTLVYYVPASGSYRPKPGQFTVYTHNRDFDPNWLAIPEGSTVTFTNLDEVTHNVFSVTPGSSFDLGYKSAGQSASQHFDRPGLVLISCHVHRYMKGDILVVPSRYATTVAANGSFHLDHLPAGNGTLYFWNPRSAPATQSVQSPFGKVQQTLILRKPAVKTQIGVGNTP